MAKSIREAGAATFLDETDIQKGEEFKEAIYREVRLCNELVALFTPWSAKRSWVWVEIGAAWGQRKPVVAVFYGIAPSDLDQSGQGKAILEDINTLHLDGFGLYLKELRQRVQESSDA
jgi:hypothetical protein